MGVFLDPRVLPASLPGTLQGNGGTASKEQLRQVARDFEAILVQTLVRRLRAATRGGKEDLARGIYEDWQDQALAGAAARAGGFGLGDYLYRALAARWGEDGAGNGHPGDHGGDSPPPADADGGPHHRD